MSYLSIWTYRALYHRLGEEMDFLAIYSKICVKRPLKIDKTKILLTYGNLVKIVSIAECVPWSIIHYFLICIKR